MLRPSEQALQFWPLNVGSEPTKSSQFPLSVLCSFFAYSDFDPYTFASCSYSFPDVPGNSTHNVYIPSAVPIGILSSTKNPNTIPKIRAQDCFSCNPHAKSRYAAAKITAKVPPMYSPSGIHDSNPQGPIGQPCPPIFPMIHGRNVLPIANTHTAPIPRRIPYASHRIASVAICRFTRSCTGACAITWAGAVPCPPGEGITRFPQLVQNWLPGFSVAPHPSQNITHLSSVRYAQPAAKVPAISPRF
jgi:hypothetical protein